MDSLDKLIPALAPVFAAGLGIQQLGEILSPVLEKISPDNKKIVIGVFSLTLGLVVAFQLKLYALHVLLGKPAGDYAFADAMITGLIISGGTEGINSILKFLKFKKEETKNEAAAKSPANANLAGGAPASTPSAAALAEMNKK
jgi:hypothetical protein